MEDELRKQVHDYLEMCQKLTGEIRKKYGVEIDSAEFILEHSEKQLELAEDIKIYLERITEYLELRKRTFNEFISQLFWINQSLKASNYEEIAFYLRTALEGLIDAETLLAREKELLMNYEKNAQIIKSFLDKVEETKKEIEEYKKLYPELINKLEQIIKYVNEAAHKAT
ncbi:MAG: hypothetical protein QXO71_00755 [Candidatus Jordarchaeaceae archaeon]